MVLARGRGAGVGFSGQLREDSIELIGFDHGRVGEKLQLLIYCESVASREPGDWEGISITFLSMRSDRMVMADWNSLAMVGWIAVYR